MGYHLTDIEKGVFGEFSKIQEEIEELQDAKKQDNKVLIICELCDLLGAIEGYTLNYHGLSLKDLMAMTKLTENAFLDGSRKSST